MPKHRKVLSAVAVVTGMVRTICSKQMLGIVFRMSLNALRVVISFNEQSR